MQDHARRYTRADVERILGKSARRPTSVTATTPGDGLDESAAREMVTELARLYGIDEEAVDAAFREEAEEHGAARQWLAPIDHRPSRVAIARVLVSEVPSIPCADDGELEARIWNTSKVVDYAAHARAEEASYLARGNAMALITASRVGTVPMTQVNLFWKTREKRYFLGIFPYYATKSRRIAALQILDLPDGRYRIDGTIEIAEAQDVVARVLAQAGARLGDDVVRGEFIANWA